MLLITVPFYGGLHYVPYDYLRYTHFALAKMAEKAGLKLTCLEAVYNPYKVASTALINLEKSIVNNGSIRNLIAVKSVQVIQRFISTILRRLITECRPCGIDDNLDLNVDDKKKVNQFPLGYHAAFKKS